MNPSATADDGSQRRTWRGLCLYALMLGSTVAIFFMIRHLGETPAAVSTYVAQGVESPASSQGDILLHVLLALVVIILAGRTIGTLLQRIGQPLVIGEVVAGIVLGPSLLGRIAPEAMAFLFPQAILPHLGVLAQLGVILYMFLMGLELNGDLLRSRMHATMSIAHASVAAPFLCGIVLALGLRHSLAPAEIDFTSFALFMGVAVAITAFPVLARILTDQGLAKTYLGVTALTCAAIGDVTAWCMLAVAVGVAQSEVGAALSTIVLAATFVAFMFGVVGPVARRWLSAYPDGFLPHHVTVAVLVALLTASLLSEAIGIHAVFGGFLLGVVIPGNSAVSRQFPAKFDGIIAILLPAFFAFTGMRTQIGLVEGASQWLLCGAIILVATVGKIGGTFVAARLTGMSWRSGAALGILMNARGLMELIVLNIGLDLGIISPTLFAMMVLMALATTFMTTPLLRLLRIGDATPQPTATLP